MTTDLITALQTHGELHKGTDLGGLLQWAILHIQSQAEAIEELRADFEEEHNERLRFVMGMRMWVCAKVRTEKERAEMKLTRLTQSTVFIR